MFCLTKIPFTRMLQPSRILEVKEGSVAKDTIAVSDTIPNRFAFIKNAPLSEPIVVIRNPASGDKKFLAARLPDGCGPRVNVMLFTTVEPKDLLLLTHFRAKAVRRPSTIASIDIIDYFMDKGRKPQFLKLVTQYSSAHFRDNRLLSSHLSDPVKEELRRRDASNEPTMTQQGLIHLRYFPKVNQLDVLNLVMPHHRECCEHKLVHKMVLSAGIKIKMGHTYRQLESPVALPTAEEVAKMVRESHA